MFSGLPSQESKKENNIKTVSVSLLPELFKAVLFRLCYIGISDITPPRIL